MTISVSIDESCPRHYKSSPGADDSSIRGIEHNANSTGSRLGIVLAGLAKVEEELLSGSICASGGGGACHRALLRRLKGAALCINVASQRAAVEDAVGKVTEPELLPPRGPTLAERIASAQSSPCGSPKASHPPGVTRNRSPVSLMASMGELSDVGRNDASNTYPAAAGKAAEEVRVSFPHGERGAGVKQMTPRGHCVRVPDAGRPLTRVRAPASWKAGSDLLVPLESFSPLPRAPRWSTASEPCGHAAGKNKAALPSSRGDVRSGTWIAAASTPPQRGRSPVRNAKTLSRMSSNLVVPLLACGSSTVLGLEAPPRLFASPRSISRHPLGVAQQSPSRMPSIRVAPPTARPVSAV